MRWMRMLLAATLLAGLVLSLGCGPSAPPEAESPEEKEEGFQSRQLSVAMFEESGVV